MHCVVYCWSPGWWVEISSIVLRHKLSQSTLTISDFSSCTDQRWCIHPYLLGFLASDSDRQRPEGQSFGLQQSKGKPAESGEEECVSKTAVTSTDVCGHSGRVAVVVVLVSSLLGVPSVHGWRVVCDYKEFKGHIVICAEPRNEICVPQTTAHPCINMGLCWPRALMQKKLFISQELLLVKWKLTTKTKTMLFFSIHCVSLILWNWVLCITSFHTWTLYIYFLIF